MTGIEFRIDSAKSSDIYSHFKNCDDSYISEIERRISIEDYVNKIITFASTYELWNRDILVGLVAIYVNRGSTHPAYITNVSIIKELVGRELGNMLLKNVIVHVVELGFGNIILEVAHNNERAKALYSKNGFYCISGSVETELWELKLK